MNEQDSTQCPAEEDKVFRFTSALPAPSIVFVVAAAAIVLRVSTQPVEISSGSATS